MFEPNVAKFERNTDDLDGHEDSDWAGEKPEMTSVSGGVVRWGSSVLKSTIVHRKPADTPTKFRKSQG